MTENEARKTAKEHGLTLREVPGSEGYYDLVDERGTVVCGDTEGLGANADLFEVEEYLSGLYLTCGHQGKRVMTKEDAEATVEESFAWDMDAYQCPDDSSHYHIGHTPKSVIDAMKAELAE